MLSGAMLPLRDDLPTKRFPIVTYALIAANVLAFVWERSVLALGVDANDLLGEYGLVPARLMDDPIGAAPTVLTSMFLHDPSGWAHLGGNMLFLWIFGDNVEDAIGRGRYLAFYLLAGLAAAAAQVAVGSDSMIPMVGASGAIAGVLAAYGSLYPRAPVFVLNPIFLLWFFFGPFLRLPAWVIILEFFVVNLLGGLGTIAGAHGGVAFVAHVGGLLFGLVAIRLFMLGRPREEHARWSEWRAPRESWRRPPRVPRERPEPRPRA